MAPFRRLLFLPSFTGLISIFANFVSADSAKSTFVSAGGDKNFTFSINIPNVPTSPDDIEFQIKGPWGNSWIGVGFGKEMKNSLMLIVYPDAEDKNFTVSPRIATGHSEPSSDTNITYTLRPGSGVVDNHYIVNGICHDCRYWAGGSLDFKSKAQNMIYAIGPGDKLESNDKDAGIRMHEFHGSFTIDMVSATGDPGDFPGDTSQTRNATEIGSPQRDHDYADVLHALAMCGTFVILFPLGATVLRIFENVRFHWIIQALGVLVVIVGAGIGVNLSGSYNHSKNYKDKHQIIGLTVVFLVLVQATLGSVHHRIYKKHMKPTIMSKIHRFLGPAVICLGVINGAFGFTFAGSNHNIAYLVIVVIAALVFAAAIYWNSRRQRRRGAYQTPAAQNFRQANLSQAYIAPEFQNDIPLEYGAPPPHGPPPGYAGPPGGHGGPGRI